MQKVHAFVICFFSQIFCLKSEDVGTSLKSLFCMALTHECNVLDSVYNTLLVNPTNGEPYSENTLFQIDKIVQNYR